MGDVTSAPERTVFLANERQPNDIKRFCTDPETVLIFGINPTFNMGNFYVSVTIYSHLMLLVKQTNIHPAFLGPCLIHSQRTFDSYFQLPSQMLKF